MARNMKKVVIIMFKFSVVVKSLEKMLNDLGYEVEILSERFNDISLYVDQVGFFMIYLPADICEDAIMLKTLSMAGKIIMDSDAKPIFIGEPKFHDDLVREIPAISDYVWMDRPVDKNDLFRIMDGFSSAASDSSAGGSQADSAQASAAAESSASGNMGIQPAEAVSELPGRKKRILIIDDDPAYAKMLREWIKDLYKVDIVTAGMQAFSFLARVPLNDKVDLILLDFEMPIADGPQVFQMLRSDPSTCHIPIMFLTGIGSKEAVGRVLALKPDGYVLKSTPRNALVDHLKSIIGV